MFLADESVDFGIVSLLRRSDFFVYSISEEFPGIPDDEVLRIAVQKELVLITEDKDFGELVHRLRMPHKGILLIRLSELPRAERLNLAHQYIIEHHAKLKNAFCVLNRNGLRVNRSE